MNNICCNCGETVESWFHGQGFLCEVCSTWGITREEIFPTITDVFSEQYHRIGKDGGRFWGRLGGGIVFTDGEKVLLLQRSEIGDHPGSWCIPGGKSKKGELPIDTARREAMEECGANEGQRFGHFDTKDGRHHFHTFLYSIKSPFPVTLSKEHTNHKWVDLDDVEGMQLHPKLKENWLPYRRAIAKHFPRRTTFQDWFTAKFLIDDSEKPD